MTEAQLMNKRDAIEYDLGVAGLRVQQGKQFVAEQERELSRLLAEHKEVSQRLEMAGLLRDPVAEQVRACFGIIGYDKDGEGSRNALMGFALLAGRRTCQSHTPAPADI